MRMAQKQRPQKKHETPEVDTSTPQGGSQVSDEAAEVLSDIDCCLAEVEADEEQALRDKAKAEYKAIFNADRYDSVAYEVWYAKYAHLFTWCCDVPYFD